MRASPFPSIAFFSKSLDPFPQIYYTGFWDWGVRLQAHGIHDCVFGIVRIFILHPLCLILCLMPNLFQDLALLESRGLVRTTLEREQPIVRFKHALTREATYNSMLHARRAELHRAAAQTLAELHAQPDLEMVLTIAEHWQRGNEDARALGTILSHAQNLIYTGRSISLTALLARLERENLNETQQRDLDIALADAHAARGEYEPARVLYANILPHANTLDVRARVLHGLGVAHYHLGEFARAIEYHEASLALAKEQNTPGRQAQAFSGLGAGYRGLGELERAEEFFKQSRDLSKAIGDPSIQANSEYNLAVLAHDRGQYADSIAAANSALSLFEEMQNIAYAASALQVLGACYFGLGDLDRAGSYYERAVQTSLKGNDYLFAMFGFLNLGELALTQGKLDKSTFYYRETLKHLETVKNDRILSYAELGLAQIAFEQKQFDAANSHATIAFEIAKRLDLRGQVENALRLLDQISAAQPKQISSS